jgi:hypothetical protein
VQVRRIDPQTCVFMTEMSKKTSTHNRTKRSRLRKGMLIAAVALSALGASVALAAKPPAIVVLGASSQTANPACPADPCQAIGKVTGFQTTIGQSSPPFVAPYDGRIVAWSIKLSAPTAKQSEFFNDFYGGDPAARISLLKPLKKRKNSYKLRNQTPVEQLKDVLGQTTTFTLKTPMIVRKGQIVALTVPTWAPVFAVGLPKGNAWLASRAKSSCNNPDDIKAGAAHDVLRTIRNYGCTYTTARLLYSATMVPSAVAPAKTPPKK